jgi:hypothetical protein
VWVGCLYVFGYRKVKKLIRPSRKKVHVYG